MAAFIGNQWQEPGEELLRLGLASWGDPEILLSEIRAKGKVRVYACSAWVRMLKLNTGLVTQRVDAVIGLNGFLSQADGGTILYV